MTKWKVGDKALIPGEILCLGADEKHARVRIPNGYGPDMVYVYLAQLQPRTQEVKP